MLIQQGSPVEERPNTGNNNGVDYFYEYVTEVRGTNLVRREIRLDLNRIPCTERTCSSPCVLPNQCQGTVVNGQCVVCPSGTVLRNNQCVCANSNQFLINGRCQSCGANERYDGSSCVCNPGFVLISGRCQSQAQCGVN